MLLIDSVLKGATAGHIPSLRRTEACCFEFRSRGAEDGVGRLKLLQQLYGTEGAEARYQAQGEPVEGVFLSENSGGHVE